MSDVTIICSHCAQHISADEQYLGQEVECPTCSKPFTAGIPAASALPDTQLPPSPPPLPPPPPYPSQGSSIVSQPVETVDPSLPESPAGEEQEKMWGLRAAMFVLPFYVLSLVFIVGSLWQTSGIKVHPAALRYLAPPVVIIVFGFIAKSWQCIRWLSTDPFRAAAMGRYLFAIYIVFATIYTFMVDFPRSYCQGPSKAFRQETIGYGFSARTRYVVDPSQLERHEPNFTEWIGYLYTAGKQLVENLLIFAFVVALYRKLRGDRPEFTPDNFLNEISFRKYGSPYSG